MGCVSVSKPTGNRGPIRIHGTFPELKVEYQRVEFPKEKEQIEAFVLHAFLESVKGTDILQAPFIDLQQNETDDFDFKDVGARRPTYLELVEIAPLDRERGGYSGASSSYRTYDFAQQALGKILGKSAKYPNADDTRLCLLAYTTDWHFELSETVIKLLRFWTGERDHVFSEIYAFTPSSAEDGHPFLIYPVSAETVAGVNPEQYRDHETYNMDPEAGQLEIDAEGGSLSFGWDVPVSAETVPTVGRNDPCPCGSDRKYKRCHGR